MTQPAEKSEASLIAPDLWPSTLGAGAGDSLDPLWQREWRPRKERAMSDGEVMQKIFEALGEGLADSEFTVSKVGDKIFLADGEREWCLALFVRSDG